MAYATASAIGRATAATRSSHVSISTVATTPSISDGSADRYGEVMRERSTCGREDS